MKPVSPCLNCGKRRIDCHIQGNCPEYDKYKEDYNEYINKVKILKDVDAMYRGYKFYCKMKIYSHMKNHLR